MRLFKAPLVLNQGITQSWKVLGFAWPGDLEAPQPGQFFTFNPKGLSAGDAGLLRRPLAFALYAEGIAYAIYQIRGSATHALAAAGEGSELDIIGPLGNSFPLLTPGEQACLAGGGIGIGPLLFLAATLGKNCSPLALQREPGLKRQSNFLKLYLGFRSASLLPSFSLALDSLPDTHSRLRQGLSTLQVCLDKAIIATDDGSRGFSGTVVEALKRDIDHLEDSGSPLPASAPSLRLYACGPSPMLSALDELALERALPAHLSAEQWMACGVGACQGCVLPAKAGGYLRACADGPVFSQGVIQWKA